MISKILFLGCSYTWGQSLHYYGGFGDDEHPKDGFFYENNLRPHHYQYNVDNRFATKVADYFGRKAIVSARNGNSNPLMVDWAYRELKKHDTIDCLIVQTTSFSRGYGQNKSETQQVEIFDNLIDYCESKDILIRFLHMDLGGDIPNPIKLSEKIKNRTIMFDGKLDWFHTILPIDSDANYDYRVVASDFKDSRDTHFNHNGHDYLTKIIIDELIKSNYIPIKKLDLPKLFDNEKVLKSDFENVSKYYNKNYLKTKYHQFLLSNNTKNDVAYDIDLSGKNLIQIFLDKLKEYDLLRTWMLVYPPGKVTGFHSDSSTEFYRYVFEIQPTNDSKFRYVEYDIFKSINNFQNKILYIGNSIHSFENNSKTDTRIAIVFDTKKPIHKINLNII